MIFYYFLYEYNFLFFQKNTLYFLDIVFGDLLFKKQFSYIHNVGHIITFHQLSLIIGCYTCQMKHLVYDVACDRVKSKMNGSMMMVMSLKEKTKDLVKYFIETKNIFFERIETKNM